VRGAHVYTGVGTQSAKMAAQKQTARRRYLPYSAKRWSEIKRGSLNNMKVLSAIFVAGALALFLGPMRWTPLWMDPQWIAAVLLAFVVAGLLFAWLEEEDPSRPDGSYSPRFYLWIVALLPWLMAGGVKANSLFDTSRAEVHHQTVISCETGIYRTRIRVTSWRPGREAENVRTDPDKTCAAGSPITVEIKSGALQLPWFSGISCR
jgi:4-amino-4-deoxy-L-arabinose transferase-like glycosyltransferase